MSDLSRLTWEEQFRRDAAADGLAIFRRHLLRLGLEEQTTSELMLEGTILVAEACCACTTVDGGRFAASLAAQTYDPAKSSTTTYAFTFDQCGKFSARLLVAADMIVPDLADLFDFPWYDYKVCGYSSFFISRLDGQPITSEEGSRLEKLVTADLMFDYGQDEIEIDFDNSRSPGSLCVTVRDC